MTLIYFLFRKHLSNKVSGSKNSLPESSALAINEDTHKSGELVPGGPNVSKDEKDCQIACDTSDTDKFKLAFWYASRLMYLFYLFLLLILLLLLFREKQCYWDDGKRLPLVKPRVVDNNLPAVLTSCEKEIFPPTSSLGCRRKKQAMQLQSKE